MRLVMDRNQGISNILLLRLSRRSNYRIEHRTPMKVFHRIGKVTSIFYVIAAPLSFDCKVVSDFVSVLRKILSERQ